MALSELVYEHGTRTSMAKHALHTTTKASPSRNCQVHSKPGAGTQEIPRARRQQHEKVELTLASSTVGRNSITAPAHKTAAGHPVPHVLTPKPHLNDGNPQITNRRCAVESRYAGGTEHPGVSAGRVQPTDGSGRRQSESFPGHAAGTTNVCIEDEAAHSTKSALKGIGATTMHVQAHTGVDTVGRWHSEKVGKDRSNLTGDEHVFRQQAPGAVIASRHRTDYVRKTKLAKTTVERSGSARSKKYVVGHTERPRTANNYFPHNRKRRHGEIPHEGQASSLEDDDKFGAVETNSRHSRNYGGDKYRLRPQRAGRPQTSLAESFRQGEDGQVFRRSSGHDEEDAVRNHGGSVGNRGRSAEKLSLQPHHSGIKTSFPLDPLRGKQLEDTRPLLWRSGAPDSRYFGWREPHSRPSRPSAEEESKPYYVDVKQVRVGMRSVVRTITFPILIVLR